MSTESNILAQASKIEQSLHMYTAQHASMRAQLLELENAQKELDGASESYRIIGNIMVKKDAATIAAELAEKTTSLQHRIKSVEAQENKLRAELQKIQEQVLRGESQ